MANRLITPQEMAQSVMDTAREVGEAEGLTEQQIAELTRLGALWVGGDAMLDLACNPKT